MHHGGISPYQGCRGPATRGIDSVIPLEPSEQRNVLRKLSFITSELYDIFNSIDIVPFQPYVLRIADSIAANVGMYFSDTVSVLFEPLDTLTLRRIKQ